jgi:hypothetical protein
LTFWIALNLPFAHSSLHSSLREIPQFIRRMHSLYERKIEALSRGMNTTEIESDKKKLAHCFCFITNFSSEKTLLYTIFFYLLVDKSLKQS